LSVLGYMLYTEPLLGLVVLFITVPQVFIVPMIQRRINTLVRERVRTLNVTVLPPSSTSRTPGARTGSSSSYSIQITCCCGRCGVVGDALASSKRSGKSTGLP